MSRRAGRQIAFLFAVAGVVASAAWLLRARHDHRFCSAPHANVIPAPSALVVGGTANSVLTVVKRWPVGSTLRVRNIDLNAATFASLMQDFREWCQHANLNVVESTAPDAEIRASGSRLGAWSYIGTDARNVPHHDPTMNLGWYDRATGRHEAGHAIGFEHEHRRPDRPYRFDLPNVYADNAAIGWTKAMVDAQIVNVLDALTMWQSAYDPTSIMQYWMPPTWTIERVDFPFNAELSAADKWLARAAYPGRIDPRADLNKRVLENLKTLASSNPHPHPVAYVVNNGELDFNGDGFNDLQLLIGLRIGQRRVQQWWVVFDGLSEAGAALEVKIGAMVRE